MSWIQSKLENLWKTYVMDSRNHKISCKFWGMAWKKKIYIFRRGPGESKVRHEQMDCFYIRKDLTVVWNYNFLGSKNLGEKGGRKWGIGAELDFSKFYISLESTVLSFVDVLVVFVFLYVDFLLFLSFHFFLFWWC